MSRAVTGLSIFVALTDAELQAFFNTFCQIIQISFVDLAVCQVSNGTDIRKEIILATNLQAISFEKLENCSKFYERLGYSLKAPRFTRVSFKCTSFNKDDLKSLEYFFLRQPNATRVKCSDNNGCVDLNLSVRQTESNVVSCM